jgi:hypothetical protein
MYKSVNESHGSMKNTHSSNFNFFPFLFIGGIGKMEIEASLMTLFIMRFDDEATGESEASCANGLTFS